MGVTLHSYRNGVTLRYQVLTPDKKVLTLPVKKTALVMTWFAALAVSAAIVKFTSLGPVVLVISIQQGMGVHVGDALVLIPLAVAGVVTAMLLRKQSRRGASSQTA